MSQPSDRAIDYQPLSSLAANPRNPKKHDTDLMTQSVDRFGFVEPIVVDQRTGYLISGHGRTETLMALEEAGGPPPDGVRVDPATGRWLVPVVVGWKSKNDLDAEAALIALNRTTELGGWSDDSLLGLLEDLSENEGGLDGVGFDVDDLDDLRASLDELAMEPGEVHWKDNERGVKPDERSYDEFLERYAAKAVRSILLDYKLPVYSWVVDHLDELREASEPNSAVILRLIEDATGQEAPDDGEE